MSVRNYFKRNRMLGLFIAILIHSAIIFGLATLTYKIAVPEGIVTSEPIEMTALTEGGSTTKHEIKTEKIDLAPSPEALAKEIKEVEPVQEEIPPTEVATALPDKVESPKEPVAKVLPTKKEKLPEKKTSQTSQFVGVQEAIQKETPKEVTPTQSAEVEEENEENLRESQPTSSDHSQDPNEVPGVEDIETEEEQAGYGEPDGDEAVQSASVLTPMSGNKNPSYPAMSRLQRHQGTTIVRFNVDNQGRVSKAWVHESSNHTELDQAALERVSEWKFHPGPTGTFEKPFHFILKGRAEEIKNDPRYKGR